MKLSRCSVVLWILALVTIPFAQPRAAAAPLAGSGETTLVDAVQRHDLAEINTLLAQDADVNEPQPDGTTAVHWAAHHGDVDLLNRLIAAGGAVQAMNRYGVTPIWQAASNGHAAVVEALLRGGADPNTARGDSGETILMIAARSGHIDVLQRLVAHGANVNVRERIREQTALMWAAAEQHPEVVRLLVAAGADLGVASSTGITPLMFGIRSGSIDVTRELLDLGADLHTLAPDDTTMLVLAMINAHWELADFLLDRGADPNGADPHGHAIHVLTFMRRALNRGLSAWLPRRPSGTITSLELAEALLAHGADVNDRYSDANYPQHMALGMFSPTSYAGATSLYIASKNGDIELMRFLIANGADPLIATSQNVTPLLAAAGVGYTAGESPGTPEEAFEAVKLLWDLGSDVQATVDFGGTGGGGSGYSRESWDGATALHGAVIKEAKELLEWLIEQGLPLDHKDKGGNTALDLARGSGLSITWHVYPEMADVIRTAMIAQGLPIPEPTDADSTQQDD